MDRHAADQAEHSWDQRHPVEQKQPGKHAGEISCDAVTFDNPELPYARHKVGETRKRQPL